MGERGPAPKRSDQRRRTNTPAAGEPVDGEALDVVVPDADEDWHPVARQWFESLARSGQSEFYQQSDWALAFVLAESISRELKPQPLVIGRGEDASIEWVAHPPKGASLAAWLKGMTALLVTEGDRRRAAIELQRPSPDDEGGADVSHLDDIRNRLRGA